MKCAVCMNNDEYKLWITPQNFITTRLSGHYNCQSFNIILFGFFFAISTSTTGKQKILRGLNIDHVEIQTKLSNSEASVMRLLMIHARLQMIFLHTL